MVRVRVRGKVWVRVTLVFGLELWLGSELMQSEFSHNFGGPDTHVDIVTAQISILFIIGTYSPRLMIAKLKTCN